MAKKLISTKIEGFVLATALLILLVISLLVLSQLNRIWLYSRALAAVNQQSGSFYALDTAANHLAGSKAIAHLACLVNADKGDDDRFNANQIFHLLLARQSGLEGRAELIRAGIRPCVLSLAQASILYVVEDLGGEPCLGIEAASGRKQAHLWRLSLYEDRNESILQLLVATPMKAQQCRAAARRILPGIQSRRYLALASIQENL